MKDIILLGRGEKILEMPAEHWRKQLAQHDTSATFSFMTDDHRRVRNFAVRELPRNDGKPLSPEDIASRLKLPLPRTIRILEDLERHLFFLVRNDRGEVSWAFPVTSDRTAHRLNFSSGEHGFAAWAEDAIATPFVQGRLRNEDLAIEIETACAHCGMQMHLTVDSELRWSVREQDANPLVFVPEVDWTHFTDTYIIDAYWRNSVFFWSEEHARELRAEMFGEHLDGRYLTLAQSMYYTRIAQSALFGFEDEAR